MRRTQPARTDPQRALRGVALKQQIIAELVAGRLRLLEATARFRQAGGTEPGSPEEWCRTVIGWAGLALCDRPERAEAVSDHLERELQSHLARHGAVSLPE
jgi:hypothetical protein